MVSNQNVKFEALEKYVVVVPYNFRNYFCHNYAMTRRKRIETTYAFSMDSEIEGTEEGLDCVTLNMSL